MPTDPVFAGFDFNVREFLGSAEIATMTPTQTGRLMRRIFRALEEGDTAFLATVPFVGKLYQPRMGRPSVSASMRRAVLELHGSRCVRCGSTDRIQIDHIVPVVWGGAHAVENMQPLCAPCNRRKGPRPYAPRPRTAP